jgi:hypothetical protein
MKLSYISRAANTQKKQFVGIRAVTYFSKETPGGVKFIIIDLRKTLRQDERKGSTTHSCARTILALIWRVLVVAVDHGDGRMWCGNWYICGP